MELTLIVSVSFFLSRPSICITHAPGFMLVLDELNETLAMS